MSCKYKKYKDSICIYPWCWITGGECQFLKSPYDDRCPILHAFPNVPLSDKEYNLIEITDNVTTDILNIDID